MEQTSTLSPVRYITEENGQRVGVVLTWQDYQYVQAHLMSDADLLPGMSEAELRARRRHAVTAAPRAPE